MHGTSQAKSVHGGAYDEAVQARGDVRALLRRAFAGESLALDRDVHSLHELTQVALALKPGATLTICHAAFMAPIERASIASVGRGRVVFA